MKITARQDADQDDETFTVGVGTNAYSSLPSTITAGPMATVSIDDVQSSPRQQHEWGSLPWRCAAHLPANAVTVAEVRGWRDAHAHVASHVLRWNRVILALGELDDPYATPMTAAESRANERRYMPGRWSRVTGTLEGIETCLAAEDRELPATTPEVSIAAGAGVVEGESATFTRDGESGAGGGAHGRCGGDRVRRLRDGGDAAGDGPDRRHGDVHGGDGG